MGTVAAAMVASDQQLTGHHHRIGLTVGAVTIVQLSVGSFVHAAHQRGDQSKLVSHAETAHKVVGRALYLLAMVNVYLGLEELGVDESFFAGYYGWLAVFLSTVVVLEVRRVIALRASLQRIRLQPAIAALAVLKTCPLLITHAVHIHT